MLAAHICCLTNHTNLVYIQLPKSTQAQSEREMASPNPIVDSGEEPVVVAGEKGHVRVLTLNRPRQLNCISSKVVFLLADLLEKWEKDDDAKLIIVKGNGRAFSAGGDLRMFYDARQVPDSCLEVVYRMYWLCYHIHTYQKTQVALVHGIVMGGGAALSVPSKFSVVTDKTIFALPEASVGLHTDCSFSYILSRLPGHLGEYLALTGARLNGKEMIAAGFATHYVPSERLPELEKRLLELNDGNEEAVKMAIEEFSLEVKPDEESVLNKLSTINKCFSANSVEEIIRLFENEARIDGNGWIWAVLKGMKRSSPTGLSITLKSVRQGRKQTLSECLKKEFRITMSVLRSTISADIYEGIRALSIDKDNAPKWNPATLGDISPEKIDLVFQTYKKENLELKVPDGCRWEGKFEDSVYPTLEVSEAK